MEKTRLLILAGGQSEEHEVSLTSARGVLAATQGSAIDATVLVITREGRWLNPALSEKALGDGQAKSGGEMVLRQAHVTEGFDVVFPLVHGPMGEDGTVQGMLELANVPYIGSGVLASSLCMDKAMSKEVLRANNVAQVPYVLVAAHDWKQDKAKVLQRLENLKKPWFVKPANLGSSVGISKVKEGTDPTQALEHALSFDRRVIVEQGIVGARELEAGILGNENVRASSVGEISYDAEFYDYETKYTDGRARLHVPADIPKKLTQEVQALACRAYTLLDCAGFARVDFFFDGQQLFLNEINTIPGFTPLSMFPKLWEHAGVSYGELIRTLVDLAVQRHRRKFP